MKARNYEKVEKVINYCFSDNLYLDIHHYLKFIIVIIVAFYCYYTNVCKTQRQ